MRERLTIFVIVGMRTDEFFEEPGGYRIGVGLLVGTVGENPRKSGLMMDYPCGKIGDCIFSRFGSIVCTDRQTHRDRRG